MHALACAQTHTHTHICQGCDFACMVKWNPLHRSRHTVITGSGRLWKPFEDETLTCQHALSLCLCVYVCIWKCVYKCLLKLLLCQHLRQTVLMFCTHRGNKTTAHVFSTDRQLSRSLSLSLVFFYHLCLLFLVSFPLTLYLQPIPQVFQLFIFVRKKSNLEKFVDSLNTAVHVSLYLPVYISKSCVYMTETCFYWGNKAVTQCVCKIQGTHACSKRDKGHILCKMPCLVINFVGLQ